MIVIFPASLLAADAGPAILHTRGQILVNGRDTADSTAILPGDSLETNAGVVASLTTDGSTIVIQEQSIVKYNGDSVTLEHGSVSVGTFKAFSVNVNCLRVVPVANEWTQYDVTNVSDEVIASALKLDINILHGTNDSKPSPEKTVAESATVHEGQQAKRAVSKECGAAGLPAHPTNPVNTKLIGIGAGVGGGGLLLCLLLCGGKNPPHLSQTTP